MALNTEVEAGSRATNSMLVDESTVSAFSKLSKDENPVHLDEAYAARTRFGRRVAHGMLSAALVSAVIGNKLPGPGTIYLSQTLNFRAPVYIGDTITAMVTVAEVLGNNRFRLSTTVVRDDRQIILDGEAVVLYEGT
jgi:3-hydroxybutyryl-CoA dehydratase